MPENPSRPNTRRRHRGGRGRGKKPPVIAAEPVHDQVPVQASPIPAPQAGSQAAVTPQAPQPQAQFQGSLEAQPRTQDHPRQGQRRSQQGRQGQNQRPQGSAVQPHGTRPQGGQNQGRSQGSRGGRPEGASAGRQGQNRGQGRDQRR